MESNKLQNTQVSSTKITTIKLTGATKSILDHLKLYPRETYEEIMQRLLEILNTTRSNPERARMELIKLEKERKRNLSIKDEKLKQENIKSDKSIHRKEQ